LINVFGNWNDEIPKGFSISNIDYIKKLFTTYVVCNTPFKEEHLDIIKICNDTEILGFFFDNFIYFLFNKHIDPMIITSDYFDVTYNKIHTKRNPDKRTKRKWKRILKSFICSKYSLCKIKFEAHINFINHLNRIKTMLRI